MNKFIRQFEREAHIDVYALGLDRAKWEAKLKLFSELIVRECCHVMESLPSSTYHVGRSRMSEEIKLHFGVETDDEVEYCPKCNAEWSGTSCGLEDCGWIVGVET